jgi:hypothetical protein
MNESWDDFAARAVEQAAAVAKLTASARQLSAETRTPGCVGDGRGVRPTAAAGDVGGGGGGRQPPPATSAASVAGNNTANARCNSAGDPVQLARGFAYQAARHALVSDLEASVAEFSRFSLTVSTPPWRWRGRSCLRCTAPASEPNLTPGVTNHHVCCRVGFIA